MADVNVLVTDNLCLNDAPGRWEYYTGLNDTTFSIYGVYWDAMTFTPDVSHILQAVNLYMYRANNPGNVTVSLRATDAGGHPTGGDLASATVSYTLWPATIAGWRMVKFTTPYIVQAGVKYAIVVRAPSGDIVNAMHWPAYEAAPPYAGGNVEYSQDSGGSWSAYPADFLFQTWTTDVLTRVKGMVGLADSLRLYTPTLYEYYNTGDDDAYTFYGVNWMGQTFTPQTGHFITSVKLKLWRAGLPGSITVSIRATDSDLPTGSDLCSGSIDGNAISNTTPGAWYEITLGDGAWLAAGVKYAIVVHIGGDADNNLNWRNVNAGAYAVGNLVYSQDSGATWYTQALPDLMFEEWGTTYESIAVRQVKRLTDSVALIDVLSMGKASLRLIQSLALSEVRNLSVSTRLSQSLALADILTPKLAKYISDSLTLAETYSFKLDSKWHGQTFTPIRAHQARKVRLKLYRVGSPGVINVSIRATDNEGLPTGPDLAQGTIDGNTITANPLGDWYHSYFGPLRLQPFTKYAIIINVPNGDPSNYIGIRYSGNGYASGAHVRSNDGTNWVEDTSQDLMFEEYGGIPSSLIVDSFTLTEAILTVTPIGVIVKLVTDSLSITDIRSLKNQLRLTDALALAEVRRLLTKTRLAESFSLADILRAKGVIQLIDSLALTEARRLIAQLWLSDALTLADIQKATLQLRLADALSLVEQLSLLRKVNLSDALSLSQFRCEYYNTGDDTTYRVYGADLWDAQTFTAVGTHKLSSVKLLLYRTGSPGTLTVSIKATDVNGHPTGPDLAVGATNANTLPYLVSYEWREIIFDPPIWVTNGVKYAIVIRALDGNTANDVRWRADETSPMYTDGNLEYSQDGGATWNSMTDPATDFMFEVWYDLSSLSIKGIVSLTDTLSLVELQRLSMRLRLTDSLSLADILKPKLFRSIAESLSVSEAIALTNRFKLTDGLSVTDLLSLRAKILRTESLSLSEVALLKLFKAISDSLSIAESLRAANMLRLTDSLVLADISQLKAKLSISDVVSLAEALSVKVGIGISEALGLAETLLALIRLRLTEPLSLTDQLRVKGLLQVSESLSLTDSLLPLQARLSLIESLSLVELIRTLGPKFIAIVDQLAMADIPSLRVSLSMTETLTLAEEIARRFRISIEDALAVVDLLEVVKTWPGIYNYILLLDSLGLTDQAVDVWIKLRYAQLPVAKVKKPVLYKV
jgi:hypothetical protein